MILIKTVDWWFYLKLNCLFQEQKAKESPVAPPSASPSVVPAQSPVSTPQANLLGSPTGTPAVRPSDDLLSLAGNSFTPSMQSAMASAYNPTPPAPASTNPFGTPAFQTNGRLRLIICVAYESGKTEIYKIKLDLLSTD